MPNLLKLKRGAAASIPTGQLAEPLFTSDTYDLYIGTGASNQRFQKYIASGTSSQFLKGDGSLDSTSYQTALTFSSPLVNTSGTISIPVATGSVNGYLSSTDWTTFNSKEPAITAGTTLQYYRGDKTFQTLDTAAVPENGAIYFTEPRVLATVLTGLNLTGGGTIAATDSVLQAFGKVQNQISALVGGATYQGVWNASTNTPTLASGTGTKGYYYVVSVAGSTNLDGITDWKIGDWAIFNGTTWDKVDNTDAVSSVNGFTGAVNLGLDNISDVDFSGSPTNTQLLRFNGTSSKWENWTPTYISAAITSLNGLTGATQTFATGTTGTDFGISSSSTTHTFNLPDASATARGVVTTGTQTFAGEKTFNTGIILKSSLKYDLGNGIDFFIDSFVNGPVIRLRANGATTDRVGSLSWIDNSSNRTNALLWYSDLTIKLSGYTTNGFVKFSGGDGTLAVDTNAYAKTDGSNAVGSSVWSIISTQWGVSGGAYDANFSSVISSGLLYVLGTDNGSTAKPFNAAALKAFAGYQDQLNGTGFVKASGTTITYDNSTYLTTSSAASTYLPLSGGTLTNTSSPKLILSGGTNQNGITFSAVSTANEYYTGAGINLISGGGTASDRGFMVGYNTTSTIAGMIFDGNGDLRFLATTTNSEKLKIASTGAATFTGTLTVNGASTLTGRVSSVEIGVSRNGADTVADGPWYRWTNAAVDRQMLTQLNASNGLTTWSFNGSTWSSIYTLTQAGAATFSSIVGVNGATEAGWALKSNGNLKIESNSGTTVLQVSDTSTGGKNWSLISAGAGNSHSVAAGSFYLRNSTDGSTVMTIASTGAATFSSSVGVGASAINTFTVRTATNNNLDVFDNTSGVAVQAVNNANTAYRTLSFFGSSLFFTGASTFYSSVQAASFKIVNVSTTEYGINTETNEGYIGTTTNHGFNIMTNNTPRLTISNGGVVELNAADATYILYKYSGSSKAFIGVAGASTDIISGAAAGDLTIRAEQKMLFSSGGGTERMRITNGISNAGSVLIGTTTNSNRKLQAVQTLNDFVIGANSTVTSGNSYGYSIDFTGQAPNNATSLFFIGADTAATRIELRGNGGIANYSANDVNLSDIRVKTDIVKLESYWEKIKALDFVKFKYKDQSHDDYNIGLIAQQVESVASELVDIDGYGNTPEDGIPLKTIYTSDLYHAAISVLKEALIRIEKLENKN